MARPGVMLYFSILPALDSLPPASTGTLLLAAMHYAHDGQEPTFEDGTLSFAWSFLKPSIDRDGEVYDEKRLRGEWLTYCRQCKRGGNEPLDFATWRQRAVTEQLRTDTDTIPISVSDSLSVSDSMSVSNTNKRVRADKPPTPTTSRKKFVPPTLDEVTAYVKERGSMVDPQGFIDFYSSKGWVVGKSPMKDWKAACRNAESWERWKRPEGRDSVKTAEDYDGGESFV